MRVGFVGLGKLGLPVALAVESRGHEVRGCDTNVTTKDLIERREWPMEEEGLPAMLADTQLEVVSVDELVQWADLVFVAVQTPHNPDYEGVTPLPRARADFNYAWLGEAVADVAREAQDREDPLVVAVISTVLPGTCERELYPRLNDKVRFVYNPFFIAMGTVIADFLDPEFVLVGVEDRDAAELLAKFYATVHDAPVHETDVRTAELTKVAYNTVISTKVAFANAMMEICHKVGADVDSLHAALTLGTRRIASTAYMRGGMGDGGGCHPRDNIAMSWLAREIGLSHDVFEDAMLARQDQAHWLATLVANLHAENPALPVVVLGKAFKPNTRITTGSPALLVAHYLREMGVEFDHYDHHLDATDQLPVGQRYVLVTREPSLVLLATEHDAYFNESYVAPGSIVVDPFGRFADHEGSTVIRVGRR